MGQITEELMEKSTSFELIKDNKLKLSNGTILTYKDRSDMINDVIKFNAYMFQRNLRTNNFTK